MKIKYLKGSPYYLEDVLGFDLSERSRDGKITYLLLNQPPICNFSCRRCFMHQRKNIIDQVGLSVAEYNKIIDDAERNGVRCLEISGEGEPMMSKNIIDIIKFSNKKKLITTLITNGSWLTVDFIRFCFENNVTLVVSLFSISKKLYEDDNGCYGSYEKVIKNIDIASKIYEKGIEEVLGMKVYRMAIHTTVQMDNAFSLGDMKKYCKNNDIFFSVAPLAPVGGGEVNSYLVPDINNYDIAGDNSIILSRTSTADIGREVCGTCLYGLNIGYEGNLLLDAHAGYDVGDIFGNIRTNIFEDLMVTQKIETKKMFQALDGFCPIRANGWKEYIQPYINKYQTKKFIV